MNRMDSGLGRLRSGETGRKLGSHQLLFLQLELGLTFPFGRVVAGLRFAAAGRLLSLFSLVLLARRTGHRLSLAGAGAAVAVAAAAAAFAAADLCSSLLTSALRLQRLRLLGVLSAILGVAGVAAAAAAGTACACRLLLCLLFLLLFRALSPDTVGTEANGDDKHNTNCNGE